MNSDKEPTLRDRFQSLAHASSNAAGSLWAFLVAVGIVIIWGLTGPLFDFSDTWQLVINTGTTIVTFLMVFLIQNTQNRDAKAMQLKLNELIRAVEGARNDLVDLEDMPDEQLETLAREFAQMHEKVANESERRGRPLETACVSRESDQPSVRSTGADSRA